MLHKKLLYFLVTMNVFSNGKMYHPYLIILNIWQFLKNSFNIKSFNLRSLRFNKYFYIKVFLQNFKRSFKNLNYIRFCIYFNIFYDFQFKMIHT